MNANSTEVALSHATSVALPCLLAQPSKTVWYGEHELALLQAQAKQLDAELAVRKTLVCRAREIIAHLRALDGWSDEVFTREHLQFAQECLDAFENTENEVRASSQGHTDQSTAEQTLMADNVRSTWLNQAYFALPEVYFPLLSAYARAAMKEAARTRNLHPALSSMIKQAQTYMSDVQSLGSVLGVRRIQFTPPPSTEIGSKHAQVTWSEFCALHPSNPYLQCLKPHEGRAGRIRIAYFAVGGLGDALLQTPLLESVRRRFAPCEIVFIHSRPVVASLFAGNGSVDGAYYAPDPLLLKLIPACNQLGIFDMVLESRFAVWALRCHGSRINGSEDLDWLNATQEYARLLLPCLERFPQYCNLLGRMVRPHMLLDMHGASTGLDVSVSSPLHLACALEDASILHSLGLTGACYVTVHDGFDETFGSMMGISRCTKQLPADRWTQLVASLRTAGFRAVQVGTAKEPLINGVDVDLRGKTTLSQLCYVLKRAVVHIDTEGGIVHVARAVNKRSIVFFGPTSVTFWGYPWNINLTSKSYADYWWINGDWMAKSPLSGKPLPLDDIEVNDVARLVADEHAHEQSKRYQIAASCELTSGQEMDSLEGLRRNAEQAGLSLEKAGHLLVNRDLGISAAPPKIDIYWKILRILLQLHPSPTGLTGAELECAGSPLIHILSSLGVHMTGFGSLFRAPQTTTDSDGERYYIEANKYSRVVHGSPNNLPCNNESLDFAIDASCFCEGLSEISLEERLRILKHEGLLFALVRGQPTRGAGGFIGATGADRHLVGLSTVDLAEQLRGWSAKQAACGDTGNTLLVIKRIY